MQTTPTPQNPQDADAEILMDGLREAIAKGERTASFMATIAERQSPDGQRPPVIDRLGAAA